MARAQELNFRFIAGQRPLPNNKGHIPTTMEWARKLTKDDVGIVTGKIPYSEKVPDVDEGFVQADLKDPQRAEAVYKVIRAPPSPRHSRNARSAISSATSRPMMPGTCNSSPDT